jgi:hypothetical protein
MGRNVPAWADENEFRFLRLHDQHESTIKFLQETYGNASEVYTERIHPATICGDQ